MTGPQGAGPTNVNFITVTGGAPTPLSDFLLALGPLAMWDYSETEYPIDDLTTVSTTDDMIGDTGSGHVALAAIPCPDGIRRASVYAKALQSANPSNTDLSFAGGGVTFVGTYVMLRDENSIQIAVRRGLAAGSSIWRIFWDGTYIYVGYGRTDSSGAHRLFRAAISGSAFRVIRLLQVYMPGTGTVPTLRINGTNVTMTSFSGPNGTQDISSANSIAVPGAYNGSFYGYVGPAAIFAGTVDLSSIETVMTDQGWFDADIAYFDDDFDRADGVIAGNTWTTSAGLAIAGNRIEVADNTTRFGIHRAPTMHIDHYSEIDLVSDSVAPTTSNVHGLCTRANTTGSQKMIAGWRASSGGELVIRRDATDVATTAWSTYPGGSRLRMESEGDTHRLYVDGNLELFANDAVYSGGANHWVGFQAWGDGTHPARLDNFKGGPL